MVKREELKRMQEMGRPGMSDEDLEVMDKAIELAAAEEKAAAIAVAAAAAAASKPKAKLSKRQRVVIVADKTVAFVLKNTVGRVARLVGRRLLGQIPDTAKSGSFHEEAKADASVTIETSPIAAVDEEGVELLEEAISVQLKEDASATSVNDTEDEALFKNLYNEEESSTKVAN